ncbi:MAG: SUMF1/EgtB/PvdO family nonheme iron enzyme [Myxococcales bacterium]|nr:SUMF1/EgtB/PvdO family nonheme iron enzyme [Myxococcales bacterium]
MLFVLGLGPAEVGAAPPAAPAGQPSCPAGTVLVAGTHHEQLQRICTDYRAGKCLAFLPGLVLQEPAATPVRTCMDVFEWPNENGALPKVMLSYLEAEAACAGAGKRLCTEREWELACEGPASLPWPYGWAKRSGACHVDAPYKAHVESRFESPDPAVRERETARLWQGVPSGSFPACVSPFGVHDLVGNVEEWVATSRPEWPYRSALKGGYWSKSHTGCRGTNERHDVRFRFYEIGFRCCAEPQGEHAARARTRAYIASTTAYGSLFSSASRAASPLATTPLACAGKAGRSAGSTSSAR